MSACGQRSSVVYVSHLTTRTLKLAYTHILAFSLRALAISLRFTIFSHFVFLFVNRFLSH